MQNSSLAPRWTGKAILLDLDGTLFDHYHSLRCAITAIQVAWPALARHNRQDLITAYSGALQQAYDKYLSKELTYEETDALNVQLFFAALGLPELRPEEIVRFCGIYKPAYRSNRRATPGAVEALVRLRESGYRLAIVSNGQIDDQTTKAEAIGICHLVDAIFTSEEAGSPKPGRRIFELALEAFAVVPHETYMVGDSVDADIRGGVDAGLGTVLYDPVTRDSRRCLFDVQVPVIHHMSQLLGHFGVAEPMFEPTFAHLPGQLVVHGLGIDLVTEKRHCMCISKGNVRFLAESMGGILQTASERQYISAISLLERMIRCIANAAMPIDESRLQISYPGQGEGAAATTIPKCQFTERDHSIRADYVSITLAMDSGNEAIVREVVGLLQVHCNNLMRDYPRAAVHNLRAAMLALGNEAGIRSKMVITGEDIDK
ncbi:HAD-like domain-containing protein [Aspergillus varians]